MRSHPLKICLTSYRGNMRCGGQGVYLWFLARELAKRGHRVDVVVGPPYPDPMPFAHSVTKIPNSQYWNKWFVRDYSKLLPPGALRQLCSPLEAYEFVGSWLGFLTEPLAFSVRAWLHLQRQLLAGHHYDLVHDVQCLGYGLLGIQAHGLPVVSTVHHPLSVDRRASFRRDQNLEDALGTVAFHPTEMQGFVARRLNRIFTSSQVSAKLLQQDFGVDEERIQMLANGIDTELFHPLPQIKKSENEILCIGRANDPTKGVDLLLQAMEKLPNSIKLCLVDNDDPRHPARSQRLDADLRARIELTGRVSTERLIELYNRAALVVVPSRFEGFGLPAVEALACGTPVVASAVGALPEVITSCDGGRLVASDDSSALATAISALLSDTAARKKIATQARSKVEKLYSWPGIASRTEAAYRAMLRERG